MVITLILRLGFVVFILFIFTSLLLYNFQIDRYIYKTQNFKIIYDYFIIIFGYFFTNIILYHYKKHPFLFLKNFLEKYLLSIAILSIIIIIYSYLYLLPSDFVDLSKNILSSIALLSNFYFYINGYSYPLNEFNYIPFFNTWLISNIFQHLIILIIFFKILKLSKEKIFLLFFIFSIFSFNVGQKYGLLSFYIIPFNLHLFLLGTLVYLYRNSLLKYLDSLVVRFFLFFLGVLISLIFITNYSFNFKNNISEIIGYVGIILIIVSQINFSKLDEIDNKLKNIYYFIIKSLFISYLITLPIFTTFKLSFNISDFNNIIYFFITFLITFICLFFCEELIKNKKLIKNFLFYILLIFTVTSSLIIIKFEGYKERFKIENVNIDGKFYMKEFGAWLLKENQLTEFETTELKRILIIGDSNGANTFAMIKMNNMISIEYDSYMLNLNGKKDYYNHFKKFLNLNIDKIIFSFNWDNEKIYNTKKSITKLKELGISNKVEIIIASQTPLFKTVGTRYTVLDKFIFENKRLPNNKELKKIEKNYFKITNQNVNYTNFNNKLYEISKKMNIKLLEKSKYICDKLHETCKVLTNKKEKIYWDSNHYTLGGIRYLSKNEYFTSFF